MKKLFSLVLLFLILFSSKASAEAQILFKSGEYLYVENVPTASTDKIKIEGIKKLRQFKTNSCGIGLTEFNSDAGDIEILDLASAQKRSFSLMVQMEDFNKIPVCNNGVLEPAVSTPIFLITDNNGVYQKLGFKLNPNTSYAFVDDSSIFKKTTLNSCQFVKIKKPDNIISDSALKISYLIYNYSSFAFEPIEEKTWENLPEKKPLVCLNNTKYSPYTP